MTVWYRFWSSGYPEFVVTTTGNARAQATIAVSFENEHPVSCAAIGSPQKKRVISRLRLSVTLTQKSRGSSEPLWRMIAWVGFPSRRPQVLRGSPIVFASW